MLILWISGVMDRTLGNLIVALMPLWLQYGSLLIFKAIEKWLEKLVEKKNKKYSKDGQRDF